MGALQGVSSVPICSHVLLTILLKANAARCPAAGWSRTCCIWRRICMLYNEGGPTVQGTLTCQRSRVSS